MAVTGAAILLMQSLGKSFGFSVNETQITEIVSAFCGVLIVLGVISKTGSKTTVASTEAVPVENAEIKDSQYTDIDSIE